MPKRKVLNILLTVCLLFLLFPALYFYNAGKNLIMARKIGKSVLQIVKTQVSSEYLTFEVLHFGGDYVAGNVLHKVKGSVQKTQGLAQIKRNASGGMIVDEIDFKKLLANAINTDSGAVYDVDANVARIMNNGEVIELGSGFVINLKNDEEETSMSGMKAEFDLAKKEVVSLEPVKFWNETSKLLGNDLFCTMELCVLNGNIFYEMPDAEVRSSKLEIIFEEDENGKIFAKYVVFSKNAKLFDKKTNAMAFGDEILLNQKENIAFLKGSAKIVDERGTVYGEDVMYNIGSGVGLIKGKPENDTEGFVRVNFLY